MNPVLSVEIDGKPVPIADCGWAPFGRCGCCYGVTMAGRHGTGGREVWLVTEDDAWRALYERKRDRDKAQREGQRVEFATIARIRAEMLPLMVAKCPHEAEGATAQTGEQ